MGIPQPYHRIQGTLNENFIGFPGAVVPAGILAIIRLQAGHYLSLRVPRSGNSVNPSVDVGTLDNRSPLPHAFLNGLEPNRGFWGPAHTPSHLFNKNRLDPGIRLSHHEN
jgi:hypothetical protein